MFEDMAIRSYSQLNNNIKINDFGLIINENIKNFGASPDGISDLGVMIEIKCPYSRIIKENYIPDKYYYQIQGQLAVCELEECDYVECDFKLIDNEEEYIQYINDNNFKNMNHGIIAEFYDKENNIYNYKYSEPYLNTHEVISDINSKINETSNNPKLTFSRKTIWYLNKMYIQKITFNDELWKLILPKINDFWTKVINSKNLPIEYKKKKEKLNFIEDND